MAKYKLQKHALDSEATSVLLDEGDGRFRSIPFDSENTSYQEYLEWVAAGNTPEAAD